MPIYDFICNGCGERFELLVFGKDTPRCPQCKGADLAKQMSTFSFKSGGGASSSETPSSGSKCSGCSAKSCGTCH